MQREISAVKPVVYGILIFLTVGITIANEVLARFGVVGDYMWVFSVAFLVAALMLGKNTAMVCVVVLGVAAMHLPDATLSNFNLDRDVLLAVVCAYILVPSIYSLIVKN